MGSYVSVASLLGVELVLHTPLLDVAHRHWRVPQTTSRLYYGGLRAVHMSGVSSSPPPTT